MTKYIYPQGSICIPSAVYDEASDVGHGVAFAVEFYNRENLLLPSFQYDPQTNLSTVISFSIDNGSKVQLADDVEPIRITFNQVGFLFDQKIHVFPQPSQLHTVSCGYWDPDEHIWLSDGCRLNLELSNLERAVCDCFNLFI